jgi:hypothetical protein
MGLGSEKSTRSDPLSNPLFSFFYFFYVLYLIHCIYAVLYFTYYYYILNNNKKRAGERVERVKMPFPKEIEKKGMMPYHHLFLCFTVAGLHFNPTPPLNPLFSKPAGLCNSKANQHQTGLYRYEL